RQPEARVGGRPHGESLGDALRPPGEAAVSPGAVQDEQRSAITADPRVHVDAADPNPLLAWFHGPHYAPGTPTRGGRPMERTPLAVTLGDFVAALTFQALPPTVVDKAKALVNHACDSYHMLTHPGVLIVPAGLATAEGEGSTGQELLTALAAGYEVQCRCARDFIPSTPAHGFRASPVFGILGAAATTAKLMKLDARGITNAIALAASFAGSLIEGQRTGTRDADFAEAQATRNAMWAASLAAQGFAGAPTALEGEGGFYYAFTGSHTGELTYAFTGPLKADLDDVVADLGRRWEVLDVKFKIYPTPGFNQPVVWLASEMVAKHRLDADLIEHATLEMNYLETLYPSPKFPRRPAPDGSGFGRTDYRLAYTLITGDYPVLERNVEDPRDAGASTSAGIAARVAALQKRIEIVGAVGRECFAPRLSIVLRDGRRLVGEYHGRELMWDFGRDAHELRRFVPGLPIGPDRYDRLVAAISGLDKATSVDEIIRLTLPDA